MKWYLQTISDNPARGTYFVSDLGRTAGIETVRGNELALHYETKKIGMSFNV